MGGGDMNEQQLTRQEMLDALSETIINKRDEAVKYRKETGIEEVWLTASPEPREVEPSSSTRSRQPAT